MNIRRLVTGRYTPLLVAWALLSGCEAPLDLSGVEAQHAEAVRRFDQFKSATATDDRLLVVGDHGAILTSRDGGQQWQRINLEGNPALIDVTACPDGSVVALDRGKKVWVSKSGDSAANLWVSHGIQSEETPMAITCDSRGQLWVTASFSTILSSKDQGHSWSSTSMDEDMQLGTIQFVTDDYAVVTGEFGAFLYSSNGGESWERGADLPDEFFPLSAYFTDQNIGWVSGLSGTILSTSDGGASWQRQLTSTKAPLYGLVGKGGRVFAAGDSGALLQLVDQQWVDVEHKRTARSYYIAMAPMDDKRLLVAGGAGVLSVIPVPAPVSLAGSEKESLADQGAQL